MRFNDPQNYKMFTLILKLQRVLLLDLRTKHLTCISYHRMVLYSFITKLSFLKEKYMAIPIILMPLCIRSFMGVITNDQLFLFCRF